MSINTVEDDITAYGVDPSTGVSAIQIPRDYLPLRMAREDFCAAKGHPLVKPAELLNSENNCIYGLYQTFVPLGLRTGENVSQFFPLMSKYSDIELASNMNNSQKYPWTFIQQTMLTSSMMEGTIGDIVRNYSHPITVYTKDAYEASKAMMASNYYAQAYTNILPIAMLTGLFGVLHINSSVFLNVGDDPKSPDIELRKIKEDQRHFLCSGHTSHSTDAGLIRRLCNKVKVRVWTKEMVSQFCTTMKSCVTLEDSGSDVLVVGNHYSHITPKSAAEIKDRFLKGELSCATLRTTTSSGVSYHYVGIQPGVLIKKVGKCYHDSASHPRNGKYSMEDYFSTFFLMVPFLRYDRPPRTLIASCQCTQGVCHPFLFQGGLFEPENTSHPLITTNTVLDLGVSTHYIPGENLCIGLINDNDNYEDCFLLSTAALARGCFKYTLRMVITVDVDENILVGDKITMEKHNWWCIPSPAEVTKVEYTDNNQLRLYLKRVDQPTDGDKVATLHGQKGVVKIVKKEDMPCAMDPASGNIMEFDMVIAMSSVVSRVTIGQILELRAGRIIMEARKRNPTSRTTYVESEFTTEQLLKLLPYNVYDRKQKCPLKTPTGRLVECEWGYGRVQLLHHLTAGKHHFTRVENRMHTKYSPKGRIGGGSIKFGDMEAEALISAGLSNCAQELAMRRDMSTVSVCVSCNRQCILCDCEKKNNLTRRMLIPYSTLVMDIIAFLTHGRAFVYYPSEV